MAKNKFQLTFIVRSLCQNRHFSFSIWMKVMKSGHFQVKFESFGVRQLSIHGQINLNSSYYVGKCAQILKYRLILYIIELLGIIYGITVRLRSSEAIKIWARLSLIYCGLSISLVLLLKSITSFTSLIVFTSRVVSKQPRFKKNKYSHRPRLWTNISLTIIKTRQKSLFWQW